jgi:xanthine dehydrogenase accessory factor
VIDAILAKRNLGTSRNEAPLTIGLGPGFEAGKDVHAVIETKRGHNLGRVILKGMPEPNTGVPGVIEGYSSERLLRAPCDGIFRSDLSIGTMVKQDEIIGHVNGDVVPARINGIIRGLIRSDTHVTQNLKIGDIDPRGNLSYCSRISEKARAIAGGVLEAILRQYNQ